ncbi:Panacea domain-containing protein [Alicyclobacillus sendaiensis]|uniref:Panacea domain-containing protein n=1 Tax=Alicyclobacillus sendaiensis TaxID=192387 RepID=UPI0007841981|nr:Panacea domain-containing protein [Alicyclobacillus sendaiensis]
MSRLRKVLLYFLSKKVLNRTEIVKYLYMYEWYHRMHLGIPGIEVKFIRWHHGPFAKEIMDELDMLVSFKSVECDIHKNAYGNTTYIYTTDVDPDGLTDEEMEIADYVLASMHGHRYQAMIDKVYSTPPMLELLEAEEVFGMDFKGAELNMDRVNGTFKRTVAGREAARRRLRDVAPRGTDEEYLQVLINEYRAMDVFRRRANGVNSSPHSK